MCDAFIILCFLNKNKWLRTALEINLSSYRCGWWWDDRPWSVCYSCTKARHFLTQTKADIILKPCLVYLQAVVRITSCAIQFIWLGSTVLHCIAEIIGFDVWPVIGKCIRANKVACYFVFFKCGLWRKGSPSACSFLIKEWLDYVTITLKLNSERWLSVWTLAKRQTGLWW